LICAGLQRSEKAAVPLSTGTAGGLLGGQLGYGLVSPVLV